MKIHRLKESYRNNASKLHRKVGDVLRSSNIFGTHKIYQEYPVNKIDPSYPSAAHKFDWVIKDLFLVIECHGEQHYNPVNFGGISDEEAQINFATQRHRDNIKMDAAIHAGYTYIVIPYSDVKLVNEEYIWQLYSKLKNTSEVETIENSFEQKIKERQSAFRKVQYQRKKEWLRLRQEVKK